MNDFRVIYRILRQLDKNKGREDFEVQRISAQEMKIAYEDWEQILIELQESGYIRGIVYTQTMSDKFPHIVEPIHPCITLKGMEYLETNSMMAKVKDLLKMAGEII